MTDLLDGDDDTLRARMERFPDLVLAEIRELQARARQDRYLVRLPEETLTRLAIHAAVTGTSKDDIVTTAVDRYIDAQWRRPAVWAKVEALVSCSHGVRYSTGCPECAAKYPPVQSPDA